MQQRLYFVLFVVLALVASNLAPVATAAPVLTERTIKKKPTTCVGKACSLAMKAICCGGHDHPHGGNEGMSTKARLDKYGDPRFAKTPSPSYHSTKSHLSSASPSPPGSPNPKHNPTIASSSKPPNHSMDMSRYHGHDPARQAAVREKIDKAKADRHAQQFRTVKPEPKKSIPTRVKETVKAAMKPQHHHHRRRDLTLQERGNCVGRFCTELMDNKLFKGTGKAYIGPNSLMNSASSGSGSRRSGRNRERQALKSGSSAGTSSRTGSSLTSSGRHSVSSSDSGSFHSVDLSSPRHSTSSAAEKKPILHAPQHQEIKGGTSGVKKPHRRGEVVGERALKPEHREGTAEYHANSPSDLHQAHFSKCHKGALGSSVLIHSPDFVASTSTGGRPGAGASASTSRHGSASTSRQDKGKGIVSGYRGASFRGDAGASTSGTKKSDLYLASDLRGRSAC